MVEVQQGLGHGPENYPRKNLTIADKLVLTYSATKDFLRATETADNMPNDSTRAIAYKKIASAFARSGMDVPILNRLQNPVDVARIHAEAGNFKAADETLAMANREWGKDLIIEFAKMKAAAGIDPIFEVVEIKRLIKEHEDKYPTPQLSLYEELAIIEYKAGKDPSQFLTHAEDKLDELTQKYPDFSGIPHDYSELAKAYVSCGNFERALVVADKIKGYNPIIEAQVRMKTLANIAEEQIARGLYQDAIINTELAVQTIEQADHQPEHLVIHLKNCQKIEVAKLYATIAKAKGLNGEDPSGSFALAMEKVGDISFEGWGAQSLIEIAKAQRAVGINPAVVLDLALKGIDAIFQAEDCDVYDIVYGTMAYEDLALTQAQIGEIDDAKKTLDHLENADTKGDDTKSEVSIILANIAAAEARLGLSSEEISSLNQEQIQNILRSNNELATEAVVYFGLDNRLL